MKDVPSLRTLHNWKDETTLVPFSGVQFLDFGFELMASGFKTMNFVERTTSRSAEGDERTLIVKTGDDARDELTLGADQPDDDEYSVDRAKALEPFVEKWTPVPVLRIRPSAGPDGREQFDAGPSCWARVLVKELPEPEQKSGHTHRVILALDTTCEATQDPLFYQAPSTEDGERQFRFVSDAEHSSWFISRVVEDANGNPHDLQAWVDEWLLGQFQAVQKRPRRALEPDEDGPPPRLFEHWARYLAFLKLIDTAVQFPKIRLIDTMSRDPITERHRYSPIDVDLVLDIGNSHTCGILIETSQDGSAIDLNDSYTLALRDLSNPLYRYNRPFESRVEFCDARFGRGRSARSRSFFWPSLVRVGPEAMRLTHYEQGTETISGLSSPKRYLWDDEPRNQDWRFHFFTPTTAEPLPLVARAVQNEMNEAGDVLDQIAVEVKKKLRYKGESSLIGASRPRFSRSSTFGLMLAEIFLQALVQINDPAQRETRKQSAIPRRLRTIILTLPTATPMQEQAIMRSRAEGALKLLFKVLKWSPSLSLNTTVPEIKIDWDEASCTQLVYLYTEITQHYGGQIAAFFELLGRRRQQKTQAVALPVPARPDEAAEAQSIRVGCIDIGGGTTDLMVMTYYANGDHAILPRQDFREGFRTAGDDLLREIVSRIVLPQIAQDLERAGVAYPDNLLKELFAGNTGDTDIRVAQQRRQYALRVLAPLGIECLNRADLLSDDGSTSFSADEVLTGLGENDTSEFFGYLEQAARSRGAADWELANVQITLRRSELDGVVRNVLQKPIGDLCEIVGHLGCDVLLLSGRPSRLSAVREMVRETMVVPPSRLVSMHEYEVGTWYPYRDPVSNRITDPKSTAAVGAMLCLLAQSRIVNFMVYTDNITMSSTARFIGQLDNNGAIRADKMLFEDVDDAARQETSAEILLYSPTFIGFRQLPHERWTTSVIYRVDFANDHASRRPKPFKVVLERREFDLDTESSAEALRAEALKEGLVVAEVEDGAGDAAKRSDISLKLHTLGQERDYWLDSGLFKL
ncbi:virulence factor SrfB [Pelagibius sp. Alg239-R121]|uniref:virulence factor SrfB n=1 Tax=Pelagibius sp. Alg239-R121 TaxID=2993448 RepID=UPI0024A728E9|nr:virulence factor SrfB [Pelagibius sp. Alg239-R121]